MDAERDGEGWRARLPTVVEQPAPSERRILVERARRRWSESLMDPSRRNRLLYFLPSQGMLDLSEHDRQVMTSLLQGRPVALARLMMQPTLLPLLPRLKLIHRMARTNLEEKGLRTLFLALGMATWEVGDGGRNPEAAVLLIPVALSLRVSEGPVVTLRRDGEVRFNPALRQRLAEGFGAAVDAAALLAEVESELERFDPQPIFDAVEAAASQVPGFVIQPRAVLGNFAYQKMTLVADLAHYGPQMAEHELIAALAGDPTARAAIRARAEAPDPRHFDRAAPDQEFLILDADASQQRVIAAVLAGQHGVIQGPPGTGKSQTIVNLIAALIGAGKRVLFVAEKRAALEVVFRRLAEAELGHLAMDLHSADLSRRAVAEALGQGLVQVREAPPVAVGTLHHDLLAARQGLNAHAEGLHRPRAPSGQSVYALQGHVLALAPALDAPLRWRGAELERLSTESVAAIGALLREAAGAVPLVQRTDPSPWVQAGLADRETLAAVEGAVDRLAARLPTLCEVLGALAQRAGLRPPTTLGEAETLLALLQEARATLALYPPALFQEDLAGLVGALRAGGSRWSGAWAWWFNGSYRQARQRAQALRGQRLPAAEHLREMEAALALQARWQAAALPGSHPTALPEAEGLATVLPPVRADLELVAHATRQPPPGDQPLERQLAAIQALASDRATPLRLRRWLDIQAEIVSRGGGAFLTLMGGTTPPGEWAALFEALWLRSCLESALATEPTLGGFNGPHQDERVAAFQSWDQQALRVAAARVRRAHAERVIAAMNDFPEQAALVRREAHKRSRHLPLRRLMAEAPEVVLALRPCWLASPLSVSQLLDVGGPAFDVVLFDEGSQVLPQDAVGAILRGRQVVVAGDRFQLPPTTFFMVDEADEDEDEGPGESPLPTVGFESLLDLMAAFLEPWTLRWHYRSRDEALIAFSNRHIYADGLVTFPGAGSGPVLAHSLVPLPAEGGAGAHVAQEAAQVVEMIIAHAQTRPNESLGVIALGIRHADRIEAALESVLPHYPELAPFFDETRAERFFVKNLERVQGDERDAIILSMGYGKERTGTLPYRFGPLLREGGERRLNVAITRARVRMTVVSGFSHTDMDPARSQALGVALLRHYLAYAAGHGLSEVASPALPQDPFEADLLAALRAAGLDAHPQWGLSEARITVAIRDPEAGGRFVLAVESDGPAYGAIPTARDRDRLRQSHLQALGWHFHRLWSREWVDDRSGALARLLVAYRRACLAPPRRSTVSLPEAPRVEPPTPGQVRARIGGPPIPIKGAITAYSETELDLLVRWVCSDGQLRTDEELMEALVELLGFARRGPRIERTLRAAIERMREVPPQ